MEEKLLEQMNDPFYEPEEALNPSKVKNGLA